MNRKQFFKLYVLVFIALYSEFNFANREMFVPLPLSGNDISAGKKECPRVGSISGRINIFDTKYFNPDYYKNIVIRVSGINYSDPNSILYEYYPDEEGCFSIKNNFHIGSSLLLYIWDTNSKYYNKWVDIMEVDKDFKSAEHLYDHKIAYKYGLVINYNTENIMKGKGSAIFFHVSTNGPTHGCVSVDEDTMVKILKILKPYAKIIIAKDRYSISELFK